MNEWRRWVLLAIALVPGLATAGDIGKWRAPDGSLYFGNRPPAESVPLGRIEEDAKDAREMEETGRSPAQVWKLTLSPTSLASRSMRAFAGTADAVADLELREEIRRARRKQLEAIWALWREFEELRSEVLDRFGYEPAWWRDKVRCTPCPSAEEAQAELNALSR